MGGPIGERGLNRAVLVQILNLKRRQVAAVNSQFVERAVAEAAVAKPLAENELAVAVGGDGGLFVDMVFEDFGGKLLAADKEFQPASFAGAVVRDGNVLPFVR